MHTASEIVTPTFFEKHILSRAKHAGLIPLSFVWEAANTYVGVVVGLVSLVTFGSVTEINKLASRQLKHSENIALKPHEYFLKMISLNDDLDSLSNSPASKIVNPVLTKIKEIVTQAFRKMGATSELKNFLETHVVSRLNNVLSGIACLVRAAVDGVLSIPMVALSVLTLGKFRSINTLTSNTLRSTFRVIPNLYHVTLELLNPNAAFS